MRVRSQVETGSPGQYAARGNCLSGPHEWASPDADCNCAPRLQMGTFPSPMCTPGECAIPGTLSLEGRPWLWLQGTSSCYGNRTTDEASLRTLIPVACVGPSACLDCALKRGRIGDSQREQTPRFVGLSGWCCDKRVRCCGGRAPFLRGGGGGRKAPSP